MTTLFRATLETRHFSFEAHDVTEQAAREALAKGLARHGVQYQCEPNWFAPLLVDVECREITLGRAYRDREEIRL